MALTIEQALARNQREAIRVGERAVKHTATLLDARRKYADVGRLSPLGLFRRGVERIAAFHRDRAIERLLELEAERSVLLARADRRRRAELGVPEGCTCPDWSAGELDVECPRHFWPVQ